MYQVTEDQRARIAELCRRFGVRRLDLFGSAARGDFQAGRSDVDFLVEFVDEAPKAGLDAYFGLKKDSSPDGGYRTHPPVANLGATPP